MTLDYHRVVIDRPATSFPFTTAVAAAAAAGSGNESLNERIPLVRLTDGLTDWCFPVGQPSTSLNDHRSTGSFRCLYYVRAGSRVRGVRGAQKRKCSLSSSNYEEAVFFFLKRVALNKIHVRVAKKSYECP